MGIRSDQKYNGTVATGSCLYETFTGAVGYQVMLECEEGNTSYIIWLTEKNKERAKKCFVETLGVSEDSLKDPAYFDNTLALDIAGKDVTFGTKEEEYKGKRSVKVAWISKRREFDGDLSRSAASFFGGDIPAIDDSDIPF